MAWISNSPHKWKNFVAKHDGHIQETLPNIPWYHVILPENLLNCASHGLTPSQFINHCN